MNPQRKSFIGPGINPINLSTQSVVLRNPPNGSTLSVRPHSNSRNSSILGVDDVSSPVASSQYSNATVRSSLIFPTSNTSSQQYCHGYLQPQIKEKHRYHSPSPYDSASTTLVASSLSNSTEDSARIWQGPNHTTMIINDPGSQVSSILKIFKKKNQLSSGLFFTTFHFWSQFGLFVSFVVTSRPPFTGTTSFS